MNAFDRTILLFLDDLHGRSPGLDAALANFQQNNMLKGGLFLTVIWYLWFRPSAYEQDSRLIRQKLMATICAMVIGILVARLLADLLPFRARPISDPQLHLRPPSGFEELATWSSFPSDHAVVWLTLAFGVLQLHRPLGAVTLVYACLLSLGRVYAGIHYPTDIIGAAIIAGLVLWLLNRPAILAQIYAPLASYEQRSPGVFYAAAFLACYEIANLFDEVRDLAERAWHVLHVMS